ncbi:MAG: MATE family efflux transporter [Gemmiger sp.]
MATDMTSGRILPHLWRYSVPLILGNCFQLGYNAVDSIIAGRFIGKEALAAEGIASPVMNLVILSITGVCMGAGVLMSEFFGGKKYDKLKTELSTTVLFGLFFSVAVAVLGVLFTRPLLRLLSVPADVFEMTVIYLRITFLGAPFTYFYNALASALKSVGDSKTPLKFLMFSSVLNAALDLIFIGGLGFGIVCSATTTVVAEAASALLSIQYIYRRVPMLCPARHEWKIDGSLLKTTLRYGSVTALQQAVQPIGKLMIQGQVNALGVDVIAAFNACTRVDDFAFTPEQSIGHGITTFVAQNRGAGKQERIRAGFRRGLALEACYWVCIGLVTLLFRRQIVGWFVTGDGSDTVIALGSQYLGTMALFYLWPAMTNGVQGFFRGMGNMGMTLAGTTIQTTLRVIFTYLLAPRMGIYGIAFACCAGWTAMLLVEVPCYFWYTKRCGLRGKPARTAE